MKLTLLLFCFVVAQDVFARDASRYPYEKVVDSEMVGVFHGKYEDWLPLKLQVGVDPSFSIGQKEVLKAALAIFMQRAVKPRVLDCAYQHSNRDFPDSRDQFEDQLTTALAVFSIGGGLLAPAFAFIARFWGDDGVVGLGYVDLFNKRDLPFPGQTCRHYLHVAINADYLGANSKNKYFVSADPEYWAGVIGHEFLHNLGYRHPNGYEGSFINEYGNCLWSNGMERAYVEGILNDREVHACGTDEL